MCQSEDHIESTLMKFTSEDIVVSTWSCIKTLLTAKDSAFVTISCGEAPTALEAWV